MARKMVIKHTISIILTLIIFTQAAHNISAAENISMASAQIKNIRQPYIFDSRVVILKNFFEEHNSPLYNYADAFIEAADTYNLDWRFLPAITGVESTFGKRIPYNSFNAYGWNNGNYYFNSWEHSIFHVSKYLREKYIDDGLTSIDQIARRYAASPDWSWKVKYFLEKIDPFPVEFTL